PCIRPRLQRTHQFSGLLGVLQVQVQVRSQKDREAGQRLPEPQPPAPACGLEGVATVLVREEDRVVTRAPPLLIDLPLVVAGPRAIDDLAAMVAHDDGLVAAGLDLNPQCHVRALHTESQTIHFFPIEFHSFRRRGQQQATGHRERSWQRSASTSCPSSSTRTKRGSLSQCVPVTGTSGPLPSPATSTPPRREPQRVPCFS